MNKISKKYKIRKLKKTNLYKNKKKSNINKFYDLSGGTKQNAKILFFTNFDKIKPYLKQEQTQGYLTDIKPPKSTNNSNITAIQNNSPPITKIDTSYINTLFDNIVNKLKTITTEFFLTNDINREEYETYKGDALTTFCDYFINDNIEWIMYCYINSNFYLIPNTTVPLNNTSVSRNNTIASTNTTLMSKFTIIEDNLLFKNYKFFLKLYTQLKFLVDNSDKLLVVIKRAIFKIQSKTINMETKKKEKKDVKNNNADLNDTQKENISKLRIKYNIIKNNIKVSINRYYILGNGNIVVDNNPPKEKIITTKTKKAQPNTAQNTQIQLKHNNTYQSAKTKVILSPEEKARFQASKKQEAQEKASKEGSKAKQIAPEIKVIPPYFKSLIELDNFINEYKIEIDKIKEYLLNIKLKKEGEGPPHVEIMVDTPILYIYKIIDKSASIYYGSNTNWCTATKTSENKFDSYSQDGPLYIIQAKDKDEDKDEDEDNNKYKLQKSTDKYQLQLESKLLMNNKDISISLSDLFKNFSNDEQLVNFVKQLCINTKYDSIYNYSYDNSSLDITLDSLCDQVIIDNITITNKNIIKLSLDNFNNSLSDLLNGVVKLQSLRIIGSFNQPLGDSLNSLKNLQSLGIIGSFNQPLGDSLNSLKNLQIFTLGGKFNQPLGDSLNDLTELLSLTISGKFNQPLGDSLNYLTKLQSLSLEGDFNQLLGNSLNNLTNLQSLTISGKFNQPLGDSLNSLKNLQRFTLGGKFNQPLGDSLNSLINLRELSFKDDFDKPLGDSLNDLTELLSLTISGKFNQPLGDSLNYLTKLQDLLIGDSIPPQLFNQPLGNSLNNLVNLVQLKIYNKIYDKPFLNSLDKLLKLKILTVAEIGRVTTPELRDALKNRNILF